ncbi:MAG: DUF2237 domain-containing protein [Bryobacteraceae bacterium]
MSSPPILYTPRNVLGGPLEGCCDDPVTGFFRNGRCDVGPEDRGLHAVCTLVNEEFLAFSKEVGNDLSTPHPEWGFPGLQPGDRWCLCAARWLEAYQHGMAPPVLLASTHELALQVIPLEILMQFALDAKPVM